MRWRGQINVWESLYIFPASFGVGLLNSSQFVGVSAAVERPQLATTISIFFLSQLIGASASGALLQRTFRNALVKSLRGRAERSEVSIFYRTLIYCRKMLPLPWTRGKCLLVGFFSAPARSSKEYSTTTKYASHLPKALQEIALSGYIHGFFFISARA